MPALHGWGVPGYTNFDELLDTAELDAVCLFLPHHVHLEYVSRVAERGLPIFLEKPIAANLNDARGITEICRKRRVTLLVGHNGLFHPPFERCVEFVRKGWLGRPLFARGFWCGWLHLEPWDFRRHRQQTGGGCWIDAGGHMIYRLREMFGTVTDVTGLLAKLNRPEVEGEDLATACLRYESGAIAELSVSYGLKMSGYQSVWPGGYERAIEIYGDKGAIVYTISPDPELRYFSEIPEAMPPDWQGWLHHRPCEPFTESFQHQMSHFIDCLDGKTEPRVTGEDAVETLQVVLSLYEKAEIDHG